MKKIIISSIVIAALGGAFLFVNRASPNVPVKAVKSSLSVKAVVPLFESMPQSITSNGTIGAWQEAILGSEITGVVIEKIYVEVGNQVKKGQLLAKLNSESIVAEVNQAKASILEAQANLAQAKANADIARSVEKTNALSKQQISQYLTTELTAQARLESAKAALQAQNVRLKKTSITSPDEGIVSYRNASVGNIAGSDMFRVILQEKLQWKAQVPADKIMKIEKGMSVVIKDISATVSEVSPGIDEKTRQGTVYVNLDKDIHLNKIKAGMFTDGKIILGQSQQMTVPQQAVILREGFNYVFVLNNTNNANTTQVKQVKVSTGERIGNNVQVSGIEATDKVVITGASFLKDEDTVLEIK